MSSQSGSILDSFRHTDITSDPTKQQPRQPKYSTSSFRKAQSTSVSFGGKSRYLCVGDNEGTTVLWDLKKQSRVRQFKAPNQTKSPAIIQACLDPTAAFMCSLSSQALSFYNLRQATFARQWTYPNTTATSGSQNSRKGGAAGAAAGGGGGGGPPERDQFMKNRGPVSWMSLFLVGVAAASVTAYYKLERERRLETAMRKVVSSESDGWSPNPEVLAKRKFKRTPWGWFPEEDAFGAG